MAGFIEPYSSNISLSALIRISSGVAFQNGEFVTGGLTSAPTAATPTSFYFTTSLHQRNPLSTLGNDYYDDVDEENDDTDYMSTTNSPEILTTLSSILFFKNDDHVASDTIISGHLGPSPPLDRNNDMFFPETNRTLVIADLPAEYRVVDETAWPRIYAYFIIFVVSAIANFSELIWVCKRLRARASPVNRLFLHLCIADLIVVFMVAAVEVLWRISIGWYAGNFMCKAVMFSRAFGLYLSSLMIICISLDRYYAVVYPLRVIDASRRVKIMLISAWATAAVCAIPQGSIFYTLFGTMVQLAVIYYSIVFREETHPYYPIFHQCSTLWWPGIERANTWLSVTMMYFIPLGVIIFAYGSIIIKIAGYLSENRSDGQSFLRRNGMPVFQRAKLRTLKLAFIITCAFVLCWSPYILISTWYLIDEQSATSLDGNIQDALFIMAVANSIANPLVYGVNESCKKRKDPPHETCKEREHNRSEAVIMKNYNNASCQCAQKTRVRFSNHSPQQSAAV